MKAENLDAYKNAYKEGFKFFDENHWYLNLYGDLMCEKIKQKGFKNVLSLAIGHRVVGDKLLKMLGTSLSS